MICRTCKSETWRIITDENLKDHCENCDYMPPNTPTEFIPERIKRDQDLHKKDIIQPFRDNTPSKEFVDAYPEKARKLFKENIKNAKYVWK